MAVQQYFRFLDLPAELRNEIYHMLFEHTTTIISRNRGGGKPGETVSNTPTKNSTVPGLLQANQQLRSEAKLIFYSTTEFVTTSHTTFIA